MDIKLTPAWDIAIENDTMVLVDGLDAIAQDIQARLLFFLGEWFLDRRIGVPYFEKILGQKPRLPVIKSIFRQAILTTPGVLAVNDLLVDYDGQGRRLSVSFNATTDQGVITFNRELIL